MPDETAASDREDLTVGDIRHIVEQSNLDDAAMVLLHIYDDHMQKYVTVPVAKASVEHLPGRAVSLILHSNLEDDL